MPALLVAVITKLAVPVKLMAETDTILLRKVKSTGDSFSFTVMPCLSVIFSTVALNEALQFASITGELDGDVMVITGGCTVRI